PSACPSCAPRPTTAWLTTSRARGRPTPPRRSTRCGWPRSSADADAPLRLRCAEAARAHTAHAPACPAALLRARALHVEPEVDHVAVLDDVLLPLDAQLALLAQRRLRAGLHPILPGGDLGPDEAPLEVGVDHAGGARRLPSGADGPGAGLLRTDGEEGAQAEELVARADELVQAGLAQSDRLEKARPLLGGKLLDLRLQL